MVARPVTTLGLRHSERVGLPSEAAARAGSAACCHEVRGLRDRELRSLRSHGGRRNAALRGGLAITTAAHRSEQAAGGGRRRAALRADLRPPVSSLLYSVRPGTGPHHGHESEHGLRRDDRQRFLSDADLSADASTAVWRPRRRLRVQPGSTGFVLAEWYQEGRSVHPGTSPRTFGR